jgi:hypothetical protein
MIEKIYIFIIIFMIISYKYEKNKNIKYLKSNDVMKMVNRILENRNSKNKLNKKYKYIIS